MRHRGSHILYTTGSQLAIGNEVVSLTCQVPFTPRKIPGTCFCQRLSRPNGHSVARRIRSIEKSNDFIGNRTCDLVTCGSIRYVSKVMYSRDRAVLVKLACGVGQSV
jgi:hypothetical protein